jgi:hypothetical protein
MDFSGLFSGQESKKNFEDAVSPQSEDLISKVLPLLSGGKMDSNALLKILANGNPRIICQMAWGLLQNKIVLKKLMNM